MISGFSFNPDLNSGDIMEMLHFPIVVGLSSITLNNFLKMSGLTSKRQDNISFDMVSCPGAFPFLKMYAPSFSSSSDISRSKMPVSAVLWGNGSSHEGP